MERCTFTASLLLALPELERLRPHRLDHSPLLLRLQALRQRHKMRLPSSLGLHQQLMVVWQSRTTSLMSAQQVGLSAWREQLLDSPRFQVQFLPVPRLMWSLVWSTALSTGSVFVLSLQWVTALALLQLLLRVAHHQLLLP
jgi:hypothetical protein